MIYRLQKKFILICAISVFLVVALVFAMIFTLNASSMNKNLDLLADTVSEGGGRFPSSFGGEHKPQGMPPNEREFGFITPETPFSTRHFTVLFDNNGQVARTYTDAIASIDENTAITYAKNVFNGKKVRGWLNNYRYKLFSTDFGTGVVFIDGSMNRSSLWQSMTIAGFVLLCCAALVLTLIVLLSKKVVKPIAESYEKQKQFITDANHELKTPLTLILANLDIAEEELGKNEWLDDIRTEGYRITELVNQLVSLTRMDEDGQQMFLSKFNFSDVVIDTVSEFKTLANARGKSLDLDVDVGIEFEGDEMLLRRLVSVLLDNAVKYCDDCGEISVKLTKHRRIILTVENTYANVDNVKLDRLFDRFYREDKARTYTGSCGIGLSIAKAIVEKHKGHINAYKKDDSIIGFKVVL